MEAFYMTSVKEYNVHIDEKKTGNAAGGKISVL